MARQVLLRYDGSLLVVWRGQHFIDTICTHMADIDYQPIIMYTGGYDDFVLAKTRPGPASGPKTPAREENRRTQ